MLIKCPECELQVSDRAKMCPHCGFPIAQGINISPESTKTQHRANHRRLPNGFGQITKISGKNLRNPYRAMVTVAKSDTGKPICKLLKPVSYFKTYNEAYEALMEYNKNPYDLSDVLTVQELYDRWSAEYFKKLKASSSERTIRSAWAFCSSVKDYQAKAIRARHIKACIEEATTPNLKARVKSLWNLMLDYALEYELVDKNYARTFNIEDKVKKEVEKQKKDHIAFTNEELIRLWANINEVPYCDLVVIQIYTGFRPQELGLIKIANVDLKNDLIVGGIKTDAGIDRIVPIHSLIKDLVKRYYYDAIACGSEYLFNCQENAPNRFLSYDTYRRRFEKVVSRLQLNPEHRPHDPRKTFTTLAKEYEVNEYAIKYIIGHSIKDLTEKVYTERDAEWLKSEMKKINRTRKLC